MWKHRDRVSRPRSQFFTFYAIDCKLLVFVACPLQFNVTPVYYNLIRYIELNTKNSGGYRRYNTDMPQYLHNKPRPFIKHCMARISSAADFPAKHIEMVAEGSGNFKCKSQSESNLWYNLSFGDEKNMPRCSCPDFSRTGLPCRHFFAVFNYYPKWQWTSLPGQYTEHPNISLDGNSISTHTINGNVLNDISNVETNLEHDILEKGQKLQNIFVPRQKDTQKEAKTCREILKQLTDMTYNIENATALSETSNTLKLLLDNF